jgi:uncharacterized protein
MVKLSRESIKRNAVRVYRRFLKLRGDPHAIGMGLSMGFFVGMSPLMGLHSIIAVPLAAVFKWSKIAALIGVFVTNPLTAPFIYPLTYTLGAAILGNPVSLGAGRLHLGDLFNSSPQVLANLFVGGAILGLAGGAVSYFAAVRTIRQYRRRRELRAHGEPAFAAVRRRLKRAAQRQRRKSKQRASRPQHPRQSQSKRRRRPPGIMAGYIVRHPFFGRRAILLPKRRYATEWVPSTDP